jgi:hypothetical protein
MIREWLGFTKDFGKARAGAVASSALVRRLAGCSAPSIYELLSILLYVSGDGERAFPD